MLWVLRVSFSVRVFIIQTLFLMFCLFHCCCCRFSFPITLLTLNNHQINATDTFFSKRWVTPISTKCTHTHAGFNVNGAIAWLKIYDSINKSRHFNRHIANLATKWWIFCGSYIHTFNLCQFGWHELQFPIDMRDIPNEIAIQQFNL